MRSWWKTRDKGWEEYRLLKPEEHEDIILRITNLEEKLNAFAKCMDVKFDIVLGPDPKANLTWHWDAKRMVEKDEEPKF